MDIKLIGLDMDGTVLRNDKSLSPYTRQIISKAIEKGIVVVPVTGRPVSGLPSAFMDIPGIHYAITSNGATTLQLSHKQTVTLRQRHIAKEDGIALLYAIEGFHTLNELFIDGYGYVSIGTYEKLLQKYINTPLYSYIQCSRRPVANLAEFLQTIPSDIEGISIQCTTPKERDIIYSSLLTFKNITIVKPSPSDLEINHRLADKGQALLALGEILGISRESIMGIGDSDNDTHMLSAVGLPIAMGNATDSLKRMCQYITDNNEQDGAAKAIERFICK